DVAGRSESLERVDGPGPRVTRTPASANGNAVASACKVAVPTGLFGRPCALETHGRCAPSPSKDGKAPPFHRACPKRAPRTLRSWVAGPRKPYRSHVSSDAALPSIRCVP